MNESKHQFADTKSLLNSVERHVSCGLVLWDHSSWSYTWLWSNLNHCCYGNLDPAIAYTGNVQLYSTIASIWHAHMWLGRRLLEQKYWVGCLQIACNRISQRSSLLVWAHVSHCQKLMMNRLHCHSQNGISRLLSAVPSMCLVHDWLR